jgi:hypothetical protein
MHPTNVFAARRSVSLTLLGEAPSLEPGTLDQNPTQFDTTQKLTIRIAVPNRIQSAERAFGTN